MKITKQGSIGSGHSLPQEVVSGVLRVVYDFNSSTEYGFNPLDNPTCFDYVAAKFFCAFRRIFLYTRCFGDQFICHSNLSDYFIRYNP